MLTLKVEISTSAMLTKHSRYYRLPIINWTNFYFIHFLAHCASSVPTTTGSAAPSTVSEASSDMEIVLEDLGGIRQTQSRRVSTDSGEYLSAFFILLLQLLSFCNLHNCK